MPKIDFALLQALLVAMQLNPQPLPVPESSLEPVQVEFLKRLDREWKVRQTEGLWLGDLLHKGLIQPYEEGGWEWILTTCGVDTVREFAQEEANV